MKTSTIWTEETLGDIDPNLSPGGTPRRDHPEYWENGTIPWVKVSDTHQRFISETEECINEKGLEESGAKKFPKGSIVMSIIGTIGSVSILKIDAAISQSVIGIQPNKKKILPEYLLYYIDFKKNRINEESQKGTHKNMNTTMVKSIKIRYPEIPIQEQTLKISHNITKLKEKRESTYELGKKLLLTTFLLFFGDPAENKRKWDWGMLKDGMVGKLQNGLYKSDKFYGKGTKIAWVENISSVGSQLHLDNLKKLRLDNTEKNYLLKKNDILITRSSHLGKRGVGIMNVFVDPKEEVCFESHIMRMSPNTKKINPYYLVTYFKTRYARTNLYVKHGNMTSVDQPEVENLPILFPPIDLQNQFAEAAKKIQKLISKQFVSDESIKNLEQSAYQKLF